MAKEIQDGKLFYRVSVDLNELSKENHITLWYYLQNKIISLETEYKIPIELVIDLKGKNRKSLVN